MTRGTRLAKTAPEGLIRELFQYFSSKEATHKLEPVKRYDDTVHRGGGG